MAPTLAELKANLIIEHNADDALLSSLLDAAVSYAEAFQHLEDGYYAINEMPARTKQGVIMLASSWYESRDGGTGGMFANTAAAAERSTIAIDNLLRLDRDWKV